MDLTRQEREKIDLIHSVIFPSNGQYVLSDVDKAFLKEFITKEFFYASANFSGVSLNSSFSSR